MKRTFILLILIPCLAGFHLNAQDASNYFLTVATTESLTDMYAGSTLLLAGPADQGVSPVTDIGFTFIFMGIPYSQFSATTNGLIRLGSIPAGITTYAVAQPSQALIGPFVRDLMINSTGKTHFKVTGSGSNRVLNVEWQNMEIDKASSTADGTFQARLYETTGVVEFVYGTMGVGSTGGTSGYSSGISSGNTDNKFATITTATNSVNYTGTPATNTYIAGTTIPNLHSTSDGNRQVYRFTPPAVAPDGPSGLYFSNVFGTGMTLNWTDNSSDETGFSILMSTDGINYLPVANLPADANSHAINNLNTGTTYYWKVYAMNEGRASVPASGSQATPAGTLSGTKDIPGDYVTLTSAFVDINTNGLSGNISLVLGPSYSSAGETFPVTPPQPGSMTTFTATIFPAAPGLSISSANVTGTLDLNGCKNIIVDGRVNAAGSVNDLVIENTSASGFTARFINDAHNNNIRYCTIKGANAATTGGVVLFSNTTGNTGNDNNTVDHCDIRDGTATPTNCIYAAGTTTSPARYNSNNTISNCNIFNYYNSISTSNGGTGINISVGNTDWTITGNSFYQTSARTSFAGGTTYALRLGNSFGNNFLVSGNYIGGSEAFCGGTAYIISSNVIFNGIQASVGTTTPTSIQGNTIQNISITTSSSSSTQAGISLPTGSFDCGTVTGNTIGSNTVNGSIAFIHSGTGTGPAFTGILSGTVSSSTGAVYIAYNIIGGIAVSTTGTAAVSVNGISVQGDPFSCIINNNIIGNATIAGSITNATNQRLTGIRTRTSYQWGDYSVHDNMISNLLQDYFGTGSANSVWGISHEVSGNWTTSNNTVRNLTSNSSSGGSGSSASVIGISSTAAGSAGQTISGNSIFSLSNTTATAAAGVTGIHFYSPITGFHNIVERNAVYELALATSSSSGFITGINAGGGLTAYRNNMVALGNNISSGYQFTGINDVSGNNTYYFNSVYIGGTNVGGTSSSYAFASSNEAEFLDQAELNRGLNIYVNERSNGGSGTGKHRAIRWDLVRSNPGGFISDFNLFYASGNGGMLGYCNGDISTLYEWRAVTGQDYNSVNADPGFLAPNATPPDLHIHPTNPTPVESAGTDITGITDDFDGQERANLSPSDIGADAGNFTANDLSGPVISYDALIYTSSTTNRSFTGVAIYDYTGVNTSAGTKPRVYYRRSSDANTFVDNTNLTNGWKYTEANGATSPFDFTIDYQRLYGGSGCSAGDTIKYFVVAQDLAAVPNISINIGGFAVQPVSVNLTPAAFPVYGIINEFIIYNGYAGTYNVGSGQAFRCLTADADSGFFKAINSGLVTGNITVNVISDLSETGTVALNQWTEEGIGSFTLTIKPDAATPRVISGSYQGGLIRLNGADGVTFDGAVDSREGNNYLTITNTATSATIAAIQVISLGAGLGATDITFKNCNISCGHNTLASFGIFAGGETLSTSGTGADNDNLTITDNVIKKTYYAIYASGVATTGELDGLSIMRNIIGSVTAAEYVIFRGVAVQNAIAPVIAQNEIFNLRTALSLNIAAIDLGQNVANAVVSRNKIYGLRSTSATGYGAYGINISSTGTSNIRIDNNVIFDIITTNYSTTTTQWNAFGIRITGGTNHKIYYNSVNLFGNVTGGYSAGMSSAFIITSNTVTNLDIRNNIFANSTNFAFAGSKSYTAYMPAGTVPGTIDNNDYYPSGTYGVLGFYGADKTSLADWQNISSQDDFSISANPLFLSNTDLDTAPDSPVTGAGTPISGVDHDFENTDRNNAIPSIGAYEGVPVISGPFVWTGNVSTNWNDVGNWDLSNVPDATSIVVIPTDPDYEPDRFPVVSTGNSVICYTISIGAGATLTLQPGGFLKVMNP